MPREFNRNAFWCTLTGNYQYDVSHSKGIIIQNACIIVSQCVFAYGVFAQEDSLNASRLFELHFFYSILEGIQIGPGSFFDNQLLSVATSSASRIVIRGLITAISWSVGIKPNPED